jgi:hypothetical protein
MTVETFDPTASQQPIDGELVADALRLAPESPVDQLDLPINEVERLAPLSSRNDWVERFSDATTADLERLIRLFTLGEMQYTSWLAGEKSPVIALVRELKRRGQYNSEVTRWIKAHTTNRFLPHGNLMDLL